MGVKSILGGLALALSMTSVGNATVVSGNSSQSINEYSGYVQVVDQASVSLLAGADVGWLYLYEQSRLNFLAGKAAWVHMYDDSQAQIDGGILSWLKMYDNSRANIYGSDLSWLLLFETSDVNIYKADISWLVLNGNARADIYGSNFVYSGGHLSGNWKDGTPFSFWALPGTDQGMPILDFGDISMPQNIFLHTVPEPSTLCLTALPLLALALLRRKAARGLTAAPVPRPYTA
jgi:hypothetical protein